VNPACCLLLLQQHLEITAALAADDKIRKLTRAQIAVSIFAFFSVKSRWTSLAISMAAA
jgi:hypothetical protein